MKEAYQITVSEPWDYADSTGTNSIRGRLVKVLSPKCMIFVADELVRFGELEGRILVLSSRFDEQRHTELFLPLVVNGGLVDNFDEYSSEDEFKSHAKFVLIGSLERADPCSA